LHVAGIVGCLAAYTSATHADVPPPTLRVRLTSPVSTSRSKPGDPVGAISVTRLIMEGRVVATPGCVLPGVVVQSARQDRLHAPASVALAFTRGSIAIKSPIRSTRRWSTWSTRETVDDDGLILGVSPRLWSRPSAVPPAHQLQAGASCCSRDGRASASAITCDTPTPELSRPPNLAIGAAQPLRTVSRTRSCPT
jgi:hypothetical protein